MPRKPADSGDPYVIPILVKFNRRTLQILDDRRGGVPRATYLRSLVLEAEDIDTGHAVYPVPEAIEVPLVEAPTDRHLHHFEKEGDPIAFNKGQPVYRRVCSCGAAKEE